MCLVVLLGGGCSRGPTAEAVREQFLKRNPVALVIDVYVNEGDGGAAYFHLKYKAKNGHEEKEQVWQYIEQLDGEWKLTQIQIDGNWVDAR